MLGMIQELMLCVETILLLCGCHLCESVFSHAFISHDRFISVLVSILKCDTTFINVVSHLFPWHHINFVIHG